VTVDAGRQFIRWGKTDIVTPTDRFAPRDYLNVVDNEFLPVSGIRAVVQFGAQAIEAVWVPRLTPSRLPLLDQRWTVVPGAAAGLPIVARGETFPRGASAGIRWSRTGGAVDWSVSAFDGFNHLPDVAATLAIDPAAPGGAEILVNRTYPVLRSAGGDVAVPTRWFTVKGEAAFFGSPTPATDEYVLYVVQVERQAGEWVLVGGYAGEAVTERHASLTFSPDRGLTRAIVGRASYTIDTNRSVAFETAIRQNGEGVYGKAEYSQARGAHWRFTVSGVAIAGAEDDFLGQYRRNAHVAADLRYSF
jgi:hypothetical protein